ncbi:MAG: DUF4359 domain-containing protein [Cyanobium sp.]
MPPPSLPARAGVLLPLALLGGAAAAGLAFTNPRPQEFESFAADKLTGILTEELCNDDGLPMLLRLMIRDCQGLVASQHTALGRLAVAHTRRRNLGLLSLYSTAIGGQRLLDGLRVPRYHATTVAIAGHFWMVHSGEAGTTDIPQ